METPPVRLPVRLEDKPRDMVWGVMQTQGRYAGLRIGEVWFDAGPLLIKFITTADKLSVQVHPDDAYAAQHEANRGGRGKTEMWYVMDAAPGARVAVGFAGNGAAQVSTGLSREQVRSAALEGRLEQDLAWLEPRAGEAVFVPAGTVHAMGAGLTICEIQQSCDITYRMYDYGRLDHGKPRELHLERALDVMAADGGRAPGAGVVTLPFRGRYFQVEHLASDEAALPPDVAPGHWVVLDGQGTIGGQPYEPRQVWRISSPAQWRPARTTQTLLVNT
jgi:mannose-6-phosphate isomerase